MVLAAGMLAAAFLAWFVPSTIIPVSWDFRNGLWGPPHLLAHRQSPYNIHATFSASNSFWMPVIIGLFLPIGLLPMQWASNIWLLLNMAALFLVTAVAAGPHRKSALWVCLAALALAIFPSSMEVFRQGQVSLVLLAALVVLAASRGKLGSVVTGALLAISLTKPQLAALFLPAYFVVLLREQGLRKVLQIGLWMLIWIGLLCLPLFLLFPNWLPDLRHNLAINNPWFYPSLYSYLINSTGLHGLAVPLAAIYWLIGLGLAVFLAMRLDGFEALLWTLAITPLFSPVIWSWDFVLMYPLLVHLALKCESGIAARVIYWGYGVCTVVFILMRFRSVVLDQYTAWVPILLIAVALLSWGLSRRVRVDGAIVRGGS
jgi:hypothetical protein